MTADEFKTYLMTHLWKTGDQIVLDNLPTLIVTAENELNRTLKVEDRVSVLDTTATSIAHPLPADYRQMRHLSSPYRGEMIYNIPADFASKRAAGTVCQKDYTVVNKTLRLLGKITPESPLEQVARERLSTVYMPGYKLTMLPDSVVQAYTLQEGRDCPAVSLYITFDEATLAITATETRLERVPVAANMRHDQLDSIVTESTLTGEAEATYPFAAELTFAFRLARHLKAAREVVRGKPELFNRPDYAFSLIGHGGQEPAGTEEVRIGTRMRGAPLDLIVAEAMILANSTWGGWLHELNVPAIYRSQASMAPGVKVRMGTKASPHAGMGVAQYTWATSPLRRYVDLLNQWQIIACARHGRTAALAAPFKPKDAALFSIISAFDAAYSAYNGFQSGIERYWTLKYLAQNQVHEVDAAVMKDGLVRADTLPLVFRAIGAEALPRGARVRVRINGTDLLTLDVFASVVQRLDDPTTTADDAPIDDTDAEEAPAGPLTLAIDIATEPPGDGTVASTAPVA